MPNSRRKARLYIRRMAAVIYGYETALEDFKKQFLGFPPPPEGQKKIDESEAAIDKARAELAKAREKFRRKPSTT